jgi:hypothetical protein
LVWLTECTISWSAGGTFALYSLICRYAKVSLLPNQQRVDQDISSFRLKLPTPELERALCVKECLEKKPLFKNILLFLVLMGTSMVIGDGILTPSMSGAYRVLSLFLLSAGILQFIFTSKMHFTDPPLLMFFVQLCLLSVDFRVKLLDLTQVWYFMSP